ncbi:MAG: hypothetical protein COU63_03080 [Candidatus Pacebacteria bacterium CG10_big_fil_rev_8_21_14_0_10_36_11]|nr:hypothetical protein [Candidatus Pacearchaeota archaeon]OIP74410.1 MAG: hypothetical protein AUK08_01330 [Candidatus Pacebacteria bacterium CG2_30_36_39]PIR64972.1 MAG: hypothetical protein COU63_03080 [Candidatus Pacebacteria bacterium CG10_big_fil_rev_8_21_14_0_10_36_11]PJC42507.1 MAG: hypothetical protein CO040_04115 [Candidatus Pacebacteria bacterium CG_4_9_14_0_2_um_filter_36_8]
MIEENYNPNQTQFAGEQPIFETPPIEPLDPIAPPKKKIPPLYFIISGALIILIAVLTYAAINRKPVVEEVPEVTPTPTIASELSPIEQKLNTAVDLLKQANPETEKYPFPPIDMELRIDETKF